MSDRDDVPIPSRARMIDLNDVHNVNKNKLKNDCDDDDDDDDVRSLGGSSLHSVVEEGSSTQDDGGGSVEESIAASSRHKKRGGRKGGLSSSLGTSSTHSANSLGFASNHSRNSAASRLTPLSARSGGGKRLSDKLIQRHSRFESNPTFGDLLSPMQSLNDHSPADLSPRRPPPPKDDKSSSSLSVSSARKRNIQGSIQGRVKVFDDPKKQIAKILLSAQEVKLLVKNNTHRIDNILYQYEHLPEAAQRKRLLARETAKERQRADREKNADDRRAAWEETRQQFATGVVGGVRGGGGGGIGSSVNPSGQEGLGYQEVRAMPYDLSNFQAPFFGKTEAQRDLVLDVVERNFVFAEFRQRGKARTEGSLETLIDAFQPVTLTPGQILMHQGGGEKENDIFYIVERGLIEFQVDGVSVGKARSSDCFGEQALLYHAPSNVTVSVALSSEAQGSKDGGAAVLQLDQKTFRALVHTHSRRAAEEKRAALMGVDFLQDILGEDDSLSSRLLSAMVRQEFVPKEVFDATEDTTFFVLQTGELHVVNISGVLDLTLTPGDYFGERALIGSLPRRSLVATNTTMTALTGGVFFSIQRQQMELILGPQRLQNIKDMQQLATTAFVKKVKLSETAKYKLADKIVEHTFEGDKQNVLRVEKNETPALYVVRQGKVVVSFEDDITGTRRKKTISVGDVFGHEQLQETSVNGKTTYTRTGGLIASTSGGETASIGVLPVDALGTTNIPTGSMSSTGTISSGSSSSSAHQGRPTRTTKETTIMQLRSKVRDATQQGISLDDLEKISLLGEGEFGEVWLVAADVLQTGIPELKQKFALKSQFKVDETRGKDAVASIRREIEVIKELYHPQVADLVKTYEDESSIHMLMGLIPGGEMWDRIYKEDDKGNWKSGLPEDDAKFYAMVVADTLGFMHSRKYIFRDLKPENIMIDADGYPIIVDFGFAKHCPDTTYTFCGTPNYVAPEVITNSGHNRSVDFWAIGVTLYEMITGENPFFFEGMEQVSLYDAICRAEYYPLSEDHSPELRELMDRLLQKDPIHRIGMLAGGMDDVIMHKWFDGLDLKRIQAKRWPAPWKPKQIIDEGLEENLLKHMEVSAPPLSLDDSFSSLHDSFASIPEMDEDSTEPLSSSSVPSRSRGADGSEDPKKSKNKAKAKKKGKKKKATGPPEFRFVTQQDTIYEPITNPTKKVTKEEQEKSKNRRSAISGALAGLGIDSDDDFGFDFLSPSNSTKKK